MRDQPDGTTDKLLREGDELLGSSQELLRDLDRQLRGSGESTGTPSPDDASGI